MNDLPLRVYLSVTERCNLNCMHCFNRDVSSIGKEGELDLEEIVQLYEQINEMGINNQVSITGGEPFLRSDLREIIKEAQKRDINIDVSTNATRLREEDVEMLTEFENVFYVQVSVDGATEETYEKMRGPGTFEDLKRGLSLLNDDKVTDQIDLNMISIITPFNYDEIPSIVEMAEEYGFTKLALGEVMPLGNAMDNREELILSKEDYRNVYETVEKVRSQTDVTILTQFYFGFLFDEDFTPSECAATKSKIVGINSHGDVLVCPYFFDEDYSLGNIREQSLEEILNSERAKEIKMSIEDRQVECNYWENCRGGCPLLADKELGDITKCDPRCPV